MSAEPRFMLLVGGFLAVLLALASLGASSGRLLPPSAASRLAPSSEPRTATRAAPDAAAALRPLLSVRLAERYPQLALLRADQHALLPGAQIVSYYGNPAAAAMGVLGSADIETVVAEVERRAALFDRLNGPVGVVPALHLVYAVAQTEPTDNGLYLQYTSESEVQRLISVTAEHGMLLFLDLQIGRSSVEAEIEKVVPFLQYPHVHLALDPEFAVRSGEVPGADLGSLHVTDVERAQSALQRLVRDAGVPPKLLIVHQFDDRMLEYERALPRYPGVELILDMDGFGPAEIKRAKYERYATLSDAYGGIKLFLDHDPDLMSEQDILSLVPTPAVVIYQ
jgi:hypothetical protein